MKTKKCFVLTIILLATMMATAQPDAPSDLTSYRGQNGVSLAFKVTGKLGGRIWGGIDNIYTDDSNLSTAVVHAGVISVGETAIVKVTILPGLDEYPALTRNGVTSNQYGSYTGSYQITGKESGTLTSDAMLAPSDGKLTPFRGRVGEFTFQVTGKTNGRIWGGHDFVYTDDSDIATAAVHAGVVKEGETGNVIVRFLGGLESYPSIICNGVTSNGYSSYSGSYQILNGNSDMVQTAPENMADYRGKNGDVYSFRVTGKTDGRIWGGTDNVYTDDSNLSTAAVHAGLVKAGETAVIQVTVMEGQSSYPSLSRNGVTSINYGSWTGSYKLSK